MIEPTCLIVDATERCVLSKHACWLTRVSLGAHRDPAFEKKMAFDLHETYPTPTGLRLDSHLQEQQRVHAAGLSDSTYHQSREVIELLKQSQSAVQLQAAWKGSRERTEVQGFNQLSTPR